MSDILSVDITIIGAGTAGLSAYREAIKYSKSVVLIDRGPLGTTCARIGCMPSKLLIQAANYFHDRYKLGERGIEGVNHLSISSRDLLNYVRKKRNGFTNGVKTEISEIGSSFIYGHARFISENRIAVNDILIDTKKFIVAIGGHPNIPENWQAFKSSILTIDNFFEQANFPKKIVTIGAGPIGLELAQALSRIGVETCIFHGDEFIGPLTDPVINKIAIDILRSEFPIYLNGKADVKSNHNELCVFNKSTNVNANSILLTIGMQPEFESLCLKNAGAVFDTSGYPIFDKNTLSMKNTSGYIAGDANNLKPILHEAADEGRIAGYNAAHPTDACYTRRTPLSIIFTEPNIAIAGMSYRELNLDDTIIGKVDFSDQGRSKIMSRNNGIMHIYASKQNGMILGSEMICPEGEHLAHLLAWAIEMKLTVHDLLKMPFYHPTVEEGIRTALRQMSNEIGTSTLTPLEISLCDSSAPTTLS